MNFSLSSSRTSSVFRFEAGTSTFLCFALHALRMHVKRSATGSLTDMVPFPVMGARRLPARFDHARDLAQQGELPEANAAEAEVAQESARPAAAVATVVAAHLELGRPPPLLHQRLLRQARSFAVRPDAGGRACS